MSVKGTKWPRCAACKHSEVRHQRYYNPYWVGRCVASPFCKCEQFEAARPATDELEGEGA